MLHPVHQLVVTLAAASAVAGYAVTASEISAAEEKKQDNPQAIAITGSVATVPATAEKK